MKDFTKSLVFGTEIKELKEKLGLTSTDFIKELKAQCKLKLSKSYITRIERYGSIPSVSTIECMAKVLKVDPRRLLDTAKSVKLAESLNKVKTKYD